MADLSDIDNYIAQKQALLANPSQTVASQQPAPPAMPQKTEPSLSDIDKYLAQKQAAVTTAKPSMLESLARGAEQGATMDFGSRLNALVKSQMGGQDYDTALKQEQQAMSAAQAAHPYAYGAGSLAGFAVPTALTGGENLIGEAGLAGAAKAGAGYGAIAGLGNTKDLTNTSQAAQDATSGALAGAAGGSLIGAAGEALSPIAKQMGSMAKGAYNTLSGIGPWQGMGDALQQGLSGNALWGEAPHMQAARNLMGAIKNAGQTIKQALSSASQDQRAALSAQDASVDIGDWVKNVYRSAMNGKKSTSFQDNRDAIDQVLGVVDEFVNGSEDSTIPGRGTQVTPLQANELKRQLGMLGTEGNDAMTNPIGRQFANRIISPLKHAPNEVEASFGLPDDFSPLKDTINDAVDNLSPANQRINKLLLAQDMLPDINTAANSEKATTAGAAASDKLQDFFSTLPDDVRSQIQPQMESAAKTKAVADKINASGLNKSAFSLGETGKGMLYGSANLAGTAVRGVQNAVGAAGSDMASGNIGSMFKTMYNQSPETFTSIGNQMMGLGGTAADIGKALVGAASKDQYGRNAIIFALQQNPAYRDTVEKHFGNGQGNQNNPPAGAVTQLERGNF